MLFGRTAPSDIAPDDGWPLAGRVAAFWAGYIAILLLMSLPRTMLPPRWGPLFWGVMSTAGVVALTRAILRREGRRPADIGFVIELASVRRFAAGVMLGVAVFTATLIVISAVAGPLRFVRTEGPAARTTVLLVGTWLALSAMEETGFRGYSFHALRRVLGPWIAQAIVAIAFALSHVVFGWPLDTVILGVLPSGILFGACAFASGGLAMPIGTHMALNVARWVVGQKESPGFWTVAVDESAQEAVAATAPAIAVAITLVAAAALWIWRARTATAQPAK